MKLLATATAAAIAVAAVPGATRAERWIAAEVPAAWAFSDPQASAFRPGALPAVGVYQAMTGWAAVGLRARAGVLADGAAPAPGVRDPGPAGLLTLSLATRVAHRGWWLEVAAGGGLTGDDLVPALELGIGVTRTMGGLELGPALRVLHVEAPAMSIGLGSADLALIGLEVRRAAPRPRVRPPVAVQIAAPVAEVAPPLACADDPACTPPPRDADPLLDQLASCRELAAVLEGGTAGDGCATGGDVVVNHDRIILSEQVLFDLNRARVGRHARPVIAAIARAFTEQPGWDRLVIEGHSDVRGPAEYNRWLSQQRADRTRALLVEAGVPADRVDAIGHGAERPRELGTDEASHARNRRVEFVFVPPGASQ